MCADATGMDAAAKSSAIIAQHPAAQKQHLAAYRNAAKCSKKMRKYNSALKIGDTDKVP